MIKKLVAILLVSMLLTVSAFAARRVTLDGTQILSTEITNTTGDVLQTSIPVTTIYPERDRVIGYGVIAAGAGNTESFVALYDSAITNLSDLEVINEAESADADSLSVWFPYPREISNGLTVRQGTNTIVIIYFVRS